LRKIFLYECKRLLWNKFFAGLVLVLLFYGWQVLRRVTILGVSHTAPFSPWSFGDFLSRMLPLLWIGALFFLTFFTSEKARRAAVLTDAAPLPPRRYALARCAAALTGTALLALACISEAACFYGIYFGWYGWSGLVFPTLVTLRWCSHWAAAGCWECSGPGCSMSGCWFLPSVWRSPCRNRWGCGTGASSPSIP